MIELSLAENQNRLAKMATFRIFLVLAAAALWSGCETSTIESRKAERSSAYAALPADQKALVDQGNIQIGMSQDAVFIAWGAPAQTLESESSEGRFTTWIYEGQWMEESRYWTYREISRDNTTQLERHLETDYFPRSYVRAEITFANGVVSRWRTLPRPG